MSRRLNPRVFALLLAVFVGSPLLLFVAWRATRPDASEYVRIARSHVARGDFTAARSAFAIALRESPADRDALVGLADTLERQPVATISQARDQLAALLEARLRLAEANLADCENLAALLDTARRAAAQPSTTYPWDNLLLIVNSLLRRTPSGTTNRPQSGCPLPIDVNLRLHRLAAQGERMNTVELTESELRSLDEDIRAVQQPLAGEQACLRSQVLATFQLRVGRQRGGESAIAGRRAALDIVEKPLESAPPRVELLLLRLRVLLELRTDADLAAAREAVAALEPMLLADPLDRADPRRTGEMLAFADALLALHPGDVPAAARRAEAALATARQTRAVEFARARLVGLVTPEALLPALMKVARAVDPAPPMRLLADTEAARAASLDLAPLVLRDLQSLLASRKLDEAEGLIRRAAPVFPPDDARLEMGAVRLLSLRGRHADAEAGVAKLAASASIPPGPLEALRGFVFHLAGKPAQAEAAYRRALAESPDDAQTLNNLAFLLLSQPGRAAEALPLAQRAFTLTPKNPEVIDTLRAAKLAAAGAQTRPSP